jgi:hypothetical protein
LVPRATWGAFLGRALVKTLVGLVSVGLFSIASVAVAPAQEAPSEESPVIVAAGDFHCSPDDPKYSGSDPANCQHRATAALVDDGTSAVLNLGDILQEGIPSLQTYRDTHGAPDSWGQFNSITYPILGNHEYEEPGAAGYFDYFAENNRPTGAREGGYYAYDIGAWRVVTLNSNCKFVTGGCGGTSPQMKWVKQDLKADPSTCELAYFHHPRFSSRVKGKAMGAAWNKLYSEGVDIILNGHQHNYERFALQTPSGVLDPDGGIRQFTVGTGGYNLVGYRYDLPSSQFRAQEFGVLKLTLNETSYDWAFVNTSGAVLDSGSQACHN